MNYNSVEAILSAGITNMTSIRDNTKNDDSTDSFTGVSWFTFNGTVASTIYASGNSWIGFGASSEHLKVNRRDGAVYSIYREEGTLYSYYRFLKIRWSGYTYYSQTSAEYKLEYDVILWDTGDISLHLVTWPTTYNTGTYSLTASSTYSYTLSASAMDVTFKNTGNGFEILNSVIALKAPFEKRYLLRDGEIIYTVVEGELSSLGSVAVTSNLFLTSGVEDMPEFSLFELLSNPELLYWHDTEDTISVLKIEGSPPLPQTVIYEAQTIPSDSAIKIMEAAATNDVLFTITFDGGITWKYYSNQAWATSTALTEGMNPKTLADITESAWAEIASSGTYQVRCALPAITSVVYKIAVKYTDKE